VVTLPPGARLGPYQIVDKLGEGGMGEVYRARDTRLDRSVAIKVVPDHVAADPDLRDRLDREARAVSALSHPHICTLHDIGEHQGTAYLVMELLVGETLADRLERGPMKTDEALRVAIQVASALDTAHRHGIVHRDLKPANVMLTRSGAKLLDFGLAKTVVASSPAVSMRGSVGDAMTAHEAATRAATTRADAATRPGTILGTLHYMAPEQLEGRTVDARTDIFAFGALLYEMLTGRRAFDGASPASLIAAVLERDPPPLAEVQPLTPPALDYLVRRAMAKSPDERWHSAHDVLLQLEWLAGQPGGASRPPADRPSRFRSLVPWLVAASFGAALAAVLAAGWPRGDTAPPKATQFTIDVPGENVDDRIAISPDGQRLAIVATTGGRPALWIRHMDAVTPRRLAGTEGADHPFWSPDGQAVAFFADGRLKRVDVATGTVLTLCDAGPGGGGSWSPSGVILFAPTYESALMRVPATGGTPVPQTTLDRTAGEVLHAWPHFLPDGRHYLYLTWGAGETHGIHLGSLDGTEARRLVPVSTAADLTAAQYAPPGHLVYLRGGALVAQAFDLRRLQFDGEPVRIAEGVGVFGPGGLRLAASGSGTLVHGGAVKPTRRLEWADRQGRPGGPLAIPTAYRELFLSRDGSRLAVVRVGDRSDELRTVWVMDVARGTARRVTPEPHAESPVLSPDNRQVAYSAPADSPPNVYVRNADGDDLRRLTTAPLQQFPTDWSPDGRFILIESLDERVRGDIEAVDVEQPGRVRRVVTTADDASGGRFSPDGHWIAYVSNETGPYEVHIARFPDGRDRLQVSTGGVRPATRPHWRADGREIYFLSADGALTATSVTLDPTPVIGASTVLFTTTAVSFATSGMADRFVLELPIAGEAPPPLTVVLNWSALLPDREEGRRPF
jgi:eukaryotic-like serine/threonine-protein kinase